jgi:hypothetical protein
MEASSRIHDHASLPLREYSELVSTQKKLPWLLGALGVWTLSGHLQASVGDYYSWNALKLLLTETSGTT